MPELKSIVKDNNLARFSLYRAGHMYYTVAVDDVGYSFPIPIEDVGNASLLGTMKAITLMRWIRRAIEAGTFVKERKTH